MKKLIAAACEWIVNASRIPLRIERTERILEDLNQWRIFHSKIEAQMQQFIRSEPTSDPPTLYMLVTQYVDQKLEKWQSTTEVGALNNRMETLDKLLTDNAEYHRKEMGEFRGKLSHLQTLFRSDPLSPQERRMFVRLCLRLGEDAQTIREMYERQGFDKHDDKELG